jgi:hypothetical protein
MTVAPFPGDVGEDDDSWHETARKRAATAQTAREIVGEVCNRVDMEPPWIDTEEAIVEPMLE